MPIQSKQLETSENVTKGMADKEMWTIRPAKEP